MFVSLAHSGSLLADSPDTLVYPDNHTEAQALCRVAEGNYQMPDPSKYNRVPPSKRRDAFSTRPSSCGRNSCRPNTATEPTSRQTTLSFCPCSTVRNDPPSASTSRQTYQGRVDSQIECLFRSPTPPTARNPIVLYSDTDSHDSSLATSLWDGKDQPGFMPPANEPNCERASSGISRLPCPTVVVPGL